MTMPDFLDLPAEFRQPDTARYAVLPVPYEGTVSYRAGTAAGAEAILHASTQVELLDEEFGAEFYRAGVVTREALAPADAPAEMMARVERAVTDLCARGQVPLVLGGEHSITAPAVRAVAAAAGDEIGVLQLDAHGDLRDVYEGSPHSHACVMARVLEITPRVAQVGVRSYSPDEAQSHPEQVSRFWTPRRIASDPEWIDGVLAQLPGRVYVTIDIDGLDPSLCPGTGTPEPGGLTWFQTTDLLRRVCVEREVLGCDLVEVRPLGDNHVTEFTAARLACKMIAYIEHGRARRAAPEHKGNA